MSVFGLSTRALYRSALVNQRLSFPHLRLGFTPSPNHRLIQLTTQNFSSSAPTSGEPSPQKTENNNTSSDISCTNKKEGQPLIVQKEAIHKKIWRVCKETAHHYWTGLKLFGLNLYTCTGILRRVASGETTLTRRERSLLLATSTDIFLLIPFIFIAIIPFMEFSLPFLLKFGIIKLPSTFQDKFKEEEEMKKQLKVKLEVAKFLQDSVEEMSLIKKTKLTDATFANDFSDFMRRIRSGTDYVSDEEVQRFLKLFNDKFTLDELSREHLIALCRYINIRAYGTTAMLRFQLDHAMNKIKKDDTMIHREGVESLNEEELISSNAARGMRSLGRSKLLLQIQLRNWISLSVDQKYPVSLLLLSRALTISGPGQPPLKQALVALPEELLQMAQAKAETLSGSIGSAKKIEILKRASEKAESEAAELKDSAVGLERTQSLTEALSVMTGAPVESEKEDITKLKSEAQRTVLSSEVKNLSPAVAKAETKLQDLLHRLDREVEQVEQKVCERLKLMDRDEDGIVSLEEIKEALKEFLVVPPTDEEVKLLMKKLDTNHDGVVSIKEIQALQLLFDHDHPLHK
eukprot:TRINITY_DN4352_c0_g1_i1.p1 TRINITY_DN4352_c0_g1~~TRINITY_DN4352_c0_g1_i1.p1  ORF type:complete len:575 (-),score=132.21 TRINITY_DN4352_c0_g1_i1:31-1755(-)